MRRLNRSRRRPVRGMTDISLTPLIDTALTLLIIFMVTTPIMQNAIKVQLPKGHAQEGTSKQDDLVVYVDNKNIFYLDGKKIEHKNIVSAIKQKVGNAKDRVVMVKADVQAQYGPIMELVDSVKTVGGLKYVYFGTTKNA